MTHYDTLYVTPAASQKIIERAYRTLSQEYHPDHNPEIDRAKYTQLQTELNKAYEVLRDPDKRRRYDESLTHVLHTTPPIKVNSPTSISAAKKLNHDHDDKPEGKNDALESFLISICTLIAIILIKKYFL